NDSLLLLRCVTLKIQENSTINPPHVNVVGNFLALRERRHSFQSDYIALSCGCRRDRLNRDCHLVLLTVLADCRLVATLRSPVLISSSPRLLCAEFRNVERTPRGPVRQQVADDPAFCRRRDLSVGARLADYGERQCRRRLAHPQRRSAPRFVKLG